MLLLRAFLGYVNEKTSIMVLVLALHSFRIENKLKDDENACKNYDYCYIEMPKKDKNILKYKHGEKSMKIKLIIYADMELLFEKIGTCHNNFKKSRTTKIKVHTAS